MGGDGQHAVCFGVYRKVQFAGGELPGIVVTLGITDFAVSVLGRAGGGERDSILSCGGKGNCGSAALGCNFYFIVFISRYIDRIGGSLNHRRSCGGGRGKPSPAYAAQAEGAYADGQHGGHQNAGQAVSVGLAAFSAARAGDIHGAISFLGACIGNQKAYHPYRGCAL